MGEDFVSKPSEPSNTDREDVFTERSRSAPALLRRFWKPVVGAGGSVGGLLWLLSRRRKKKRAEPEWKKPLMALSGAVLLIRQRLRAAKRRGK
ncbi:MAG: hypothetical protein ACRDJG_02740 [Actinomycetota bacterium]